MGLLRPPVSNVPRAQPGPTEAPQDPRQAGEEAGSAQEPWGGLPAGGGQHDSEWELSGFRGGGGPEGGQWVLPTGGRWRGLGSCLHGKLSSRECGLCGAGRQSCRGAGAPGAPRGALSHQRTVLGPGTVPWTRGSLAHCFLPQSWDPSPAKPSPTAPGPRPSLLQVSVGGEKGVPGTRWWRPCVTRVLMGTAETAGAQSPQQREPRLRALRGGAGRGVKLPPGGGVRCSRYKPALEGGSDWSFRKMPRGAGMLPCHSRSLVQGPATHPCRMALWVPCGAARAAWA